MDQNFNDSPWEWERIFLNHGWEAINIWSVLGLNEKYLCECWGAF